MPPSLASRCLVPFNQLGVEDLFREARVRHLDGVAAPSELVVMAWVPVSSRTLVLVRLSII